MSKLLFDISYCACKLSNIKHMVKISHIMSYPEFDANLVVV